jgi:putative FmdB family regulatory protein
MPNTSQTDDQDQRWKSHTYSGPLADNEQRESTREGNEMPLYEYECQRCGRLFDARRGIDESEAGVECPTCGAKEVKRVFSRFATAWSDSSCSSTGFT